MLTATGGGAVIEKGSFIPPAGEAKGSVVLAPKSEEASPPLLAGVPALIPGRGSGILGTGGASGISVSDCTNSSDSVESSNNEVVSVTATSVVQNSSTASICDSVGVSLRYSGVRPGEEKVEMGSSLGGERAGCPSGVGSCT